ncbi:MAG: type I methionyl aminopeptidase, partial [Micrococcales bacterium]|nr:type I methionyl aminopeptidase [Micrococcales bacterium]
FPATTCVSVNGGVIHGIPSKSRIVKEGDIVSVDCGAIVDGWHGDSAMTAVLGPADPQDVALVEATRVAMWTGIAALAGAARTSAVGEAIDELVGDRFGIVEDYVGHGIGTAMHQPPDVPNYRTHYRGARVEPGLVVAVEPMLTRGGGGTFELADGWTAKTSDGSRAAHWEHTVAVLPGGRLWVLTARDGGVAGLAAWPGVAATPGEV